MCKFLKKSGRWVKHPELLLAMTLAAAPGMTQAELLDNAIGSPFISYDNQGKTNYTANSDRFLVAGSPLQLKLAGEGPVFITPIPGSNPGETFTIDIRVDSMGALSGGIFGPDLIVGGEVTLPNGNFYSGTLLTAEVTGFGYQDSGGTTDSYDFTFTVTGGQLEFLYPTVVGVELTSEASSFTGSFEVDFYGQAKGTLGGITAALGDRVWEDLNANGIQDCQDSNGNGILGDVDPASPNDPSKSDQGSECGDSSSGGAGIAGVPVNLYQPDGEGNCTVDLGEQVITGADGLYLFEDLEPGDYCVQFGKPPADFCDTDGYELGAPQFTTQNQGIDEQLDSDADQSTGFTDFLTLGPGETNRTLDAGFVCPAKIGDRVWEDSNKDGLQDGDEPDIENVVVDLYDCGPDGVAGTPDDFYTGQSRTTNSTGMYMFGAEPGVFDLPPGDYFVKFNPATFPPDFDFTVPKAGSDDAIDSDCLPPDGITACTTLGSRDINLNRDCGLIPPPVPECGIGLDMKCRVEPLPPTDIEKCEGKLQQFTLVWDGPDGITIDGVNMGTTSATGPVNNGEEVTFFGPYKDNDVVVDISGSVNGESTFHVSCSDDDFNGSDDCGKLAGNGKDDKNGFINLWRLEGFVDADGQVLDCTPTGDGEFADNCTFTPPPVPSCETVDKPTSLTFEYTGGACPGDNDQGDKSKCSGTVDGEAAASISVNLGDDYSVSPAMVEPGELFTVTRGGSDFKSTTDIDLSNTGGTQLNEVHTSCSAPLAVGDEFGAITLVGINGQYGGVNVTYQYVVTNQGDPLNDVTVTDSEFGCIAGIEGDCDYAPFDLGSPDTETLEISALISGTTINTGTASAMLGGESCQASDTVKVEAEGPPASVCNVTPGEFKLGDNKFEWKLTNAGTDKVTVESIEVSWPDGFGQLKKIKLDGDIVKDVKLDSPASIPEDAAFTDDLKNRQIKAGDTKELKFEFTDKYKEASLADISITVNFEEGCSLEFVPGSQPFVCKDAKPIDLLSMIWNGPEPVTVTTVGYDGVEQKVENVTKGTVVTFDRLSDLGNDVYWDITGTIEGYSGFHMSCSDDDMNGPEDCNTLQGDNKDNDDGLNLWLFNGMEGLDGTGFRCNP